ncbi:MAG: 4-amino-4-deoxy-L-arabinose transferase-like glycosyltransferase, partial [Planctomycetota bacterium]
MLCLHGIGWGLPNTNGWHGDSLCHHTLRALGDGFAGFTKYPPVHHVVLAIVYAPYLAWLWMSGGLNVSAGSLEQAFEDPVASMTVLIALTRLVSVAMTVSTVGILYLLAVRLTANRTAGLIAGALFAVSVEVVLFAKLTMVDAPMVFWFALGLLAYVRFLESFRTRDGVLLGVVVALGVCTKEQIGGAWVLAGLGALLAAGQRRARDQNAQATRAVLWAGLSWALTYGLCSKLFLDPAGWAERMREWLDGGTDPDLWGGHPRTVAGHVALLRDTATNLVGAWGAGPLVLCAVAGLSVAIRGTLVVRLLALLVPSYYFFTIVPLHYVMSRFTMPMVLLLALLGGLGIAQALALGGARKALACLALTLALGQGGYRAWHA